MNLLVWRKNVVDLEWEEKVARWRFPVPVGTWWYCWHRRRGERWWIWRVRWAGSRGRAHICRRSGGGESCRRRRGWGRRWEGEEKRMKTGTTMSCWWRRCCHCTPSEKIKPRWKEKKVRNGGEFGEGDVGEEEWRVRGLNKGNGAVLSQRVESQRHITVSH